MTWRGVWTGLGVYLLLAGTLYLTPLRLPVVVTAGKEHAAFQYRLRHQGDAVSLLERQSRAADVSGDVHAALERAREDYELLRSRFDSWRRLHATVSPFGFMAWGADLWPWLLSFGVAFPLLGGVIGAQARASRRAREGTSPQPSPVSSGEVREKELPAPGSPDAAVTANDSPAKSSSPEYPPLQEGERPRTDLPGEASQRPETEEAPPPVAPEAPFVPPPASGGAPEIPKDAPGSKAAVKPWKKSLEEELFGDRKGPIARPAAPRRKLPPVPSPHRPGNGPTSPDSPDSRPD